MVWVGTLNAKKQKKQVVSGHFAVCQAHGTRRTDYPLPCAAGPGTRRSMLPPGPQPGLRRVSKSRLTANLSPSPCAQGPRRTAKFLIFAVCHTASTRRSWPRRRKLRPTPFVTFISPCATNNTRRMCSPCARYLTHGEHSLRRGSGCRRRFAVGHPRRSFRRVLNGLRRVRLAHGEMRKSGGEFWLFQYVSYICIGTRLLGTVKVSLPIIYESGIGTSQYHLIGRYLLGNCWRYF